MTAPAYRARALADVGRLAEAEKEVRAGLIESPADPELLSLLAGLLRLQGRRADALDAASAAVAADPHLPGVHIERAECLMLDDGAADDPRTAEALREAEEAVRLDPAHAPAHRVLARVLALRKDFGGARAAVERALELHPHSVTDLLTLGEIERHAGNRGAARKAVTAALAQDPGHPDGRWLIALLDAERLRVRSSLRGLRDLAADHPAKLNSAALAWPVRGLLGGLRRGLAAGVPLTAVLAAAALLWPSWQVAARAAALTVVIVMIGFGLRVLIPAGLLPWRCLTLLPSRQRRAVRAGWVAAVATVALLLGYAGTGHWLALTTGFAGLGALLMAGRAEHR
ncbi:tetratricopeptide repeat protein [Actinoplanes sp. NPDC023714]|uniref:tetratricopeptide repeat protein n=1 Tax=Actinoplanes sp. NPDC023714 TaxID=3154322 RepID=UPI0033FA00F0